MANYQIIYGFQNFQNFQKNLKTAKIRNVFQTVLIESCSGRIPKNINVPILMFIYLTKEPTLIFSGCVRGITRLGQKISITQNNFQNF